MNPIFMWLVSNPFIALTLALMCIVGFSPVLVTLSDDRRRRIAMAFRDAIRLSNQTMRQAAQEAEMDQAQFQRQIEMTEGTLKRLAMQPEAFWQWLGVTVSAEFGLPVEAQRAAKLAFATRGLKRMARAEMETRQAERREA